MIGGLEKEIGLNTYRDYLNGKLDDAGGEYEGEECAIHAAAKMRQYIEDTGLDLVCGRIRNWANDRNLIDGSTAQAQTVKLLEEAGELAGGVCRNNHEVIADSIGDCVVVLVILAAQCGLDFGECVEGAYNEIKDRRGVMRDGMFIKEEA